MQGSLVLLQTDLIMIYCMQHTTTVFYVHVKPRECLRVWYVYDFTLPSGQVHKAHKRWGLNLGPMHNPDRPHGQRNLEAFVDLRRNMSVIQQV